MLHAIVEHERVQACVSQEQLAQRSGVDLAVIQESEAGRIALSVEIATKLLESLGKQLAVGTVSRENILPQIITAMRRSLQDKLENEVLRLVAELYGKLEHCSNEQILQETKADPGLLGNPKWDAMVAGIVEMATRAKGVRAPTWTALESRFAEPCHFISQYKSTWASAFVNTPPELANRGIFIHHSSLESV